MVVTQWTLQLTLQGGMSTYPHHVVRSVKFSWWIVLKGAARWQLKPFDGCLQERGTLCIICTGNRYVVIYADWWHVLQTTLERHVNGHFNQSEAGNGNAGARRSLESASSKLFRRNGKKLRYRRQPWSGKGLCFGLHCQLLRITYIKLFQNYTSVALMSVWYVCHLVLGTKFMIIMYVNLSQC